MPIEINGEEYCVQRFYDLLFEEHQLPDGTLTGKPRIQWAWEQADMAVEAPVAATGYTDEVTVLPRDDAAKISIWCDSVTGVTPRTQQPINMTSHALGNFFETMVIVIMYTFTSRQGDMGATKRKAGQVIRDLVYNMIRSYIKGAHNFQVNADYRFGSERMQGGSRRGFRGNNKFPGHMKESLLIAVSFDLKRDVPVIFG